MVTQNRHIRPGDVVKVTSDLFHLYESLYNPNELSRHVRDLHANEHMLVIAVIQDDSFFVMANDDGMFGWIFDWQVVGVSTQHEQPTYSTDEVD